jgi:hypothetical protein
MTPKAKAEELVNTFKCTTVLKAEILNDAAKSCALLAVDEIIESALPIWDGFHSDARNDFERYWNDIKTEIENL